MFHGFFLVDKLKGVNSFKLVMILRKILGQKKVGFAGTLDPLASGLMLFAVGEMTKTLSFLEKQDKVYEVELFLGASSDTYELEGKITEHSLKDFEVPSKSRLEDILKKSFLGEINQIPPLYSAIQIQGHRAYDLARKGQKVDLKSRKVFIYDSELLEYSWPKAKLRIHCSSGTYIRSIVHDLGQILGCGAYVVGLRRFTIGKFNIENASKLEEISLANLQAHLKSPAEFLHDWPRVDLIEREYQILKLGNFIDNRFNYTQKPILAFIHDACVGILEPSSEVGKLKFFRKFNIVP